MAGAGAFLLEAVYDVPESAALSPLRVRTRRIVEFDAAEEGIQVDLFLRNHAERLDPRHESRLARLMRTHPGELLDVPSSDVHEDRLRRVVEVETRSDVIGLDLAGRSVEGLPSERAAVAAGNCFRIRQDHVVHRVPRTFRVRKDPMLNPQSRAKSSGVVDPCRTVRRDPFIDRDPDQLDVASVPEELRQERRGRARVLSAAHADRDALSAPQVDLGSELALHAPLHELEKVIAAQVIPAVADPFDRRGSASIAGHGQSNRRRRLRPHGPGGGPHGGGPDGAGGPTCAAPGGGATAGPGMYGGAAPK